MRLFEYENHKTRIVFVDGEIFEGTTFDYVSALDNPEEKASLCIMKDGRNTTIFEDEIAQIELID